MVHLFSTSKRKLSRRIEWSHFEDFKTRAQIILFVLFCLVFSLLTLKCNMAVGGGPLRKKERKKKKKGQQSRLTSAAFWTLAKRHDKRPPQVTCGTCLTLSVCPAAWPESTWSCQHCFKPTHPLRKAKPLVVVGEKWLRSADVGPPAYEDVPAAAAHHGSPLWFIPVDQWRGLSSGRPEDRQSSLNWLEGGGVGGA